MVCVLSLLYGVVYVECLCFFYFFFFFFKQKTAYEMRISDWSSDVCSSDLLDGHRLVLERHQGDRALPHAIHPAEDNKLVPVRLQGVENRDAFRDRKSVV